MSDPSSESFKSEASTAQASEVPPAKTWEKMIGMRVDLGPLGTAKEAKKVWAQQEEEIQKAQSAGPQVAVQIVKTK